MVNQYIGIYNEYVVPFHQLQNRVRFDNHVIASALKYYLPNDATIPTSEYHNQIQQLEAELTAMKSTIGWKVLNKLRSNNSWVLKLGKKCMFLVLRFTKH
ncbi:hypothetical protein D3C76_1373150 [compost metagenome]